MADRRAAESGGAGRRDTSASRGRRKRAGRGTGAALRPGYRAAGTVAGINAGSAPAGVGFRAGIRGRGGAVAVAGVVQNKGRGRLCALRPVRAAAAVDGRLGVGAWYTVTYLITITYAYQVDYFPLTCPSFSTGCQRAENTVHGRTGIAGPRVRIADQRQIPRIGSEPRPCCSSKHGEPWSSRIGGADQRNAGRVRVHGSPLTWPTTRGAADFTDRPRRILT